MFCFLYPSLIPSDLELSLCSCRGFWVYDYWVFSVRIIFFFFNSIWSTLVGLSPLNRLTSRLPMGPVRGLKRKRKVEKKVERNSSAAPAPSEKEQEPVDWWHEFSKRITGPLSLSKDSDKFESILKVSRNTFNYICSLVKEDMMAKPSNFVGTNGKPLSINDQVAIALRRLSSGESLLTIGDSFGINQSTVSQVTWRFVEAMEERGLHHLQWPATEAEMAEIKSKFERIRGLPNCCGAIDTTHIMMCLPSMDSSNNVWFDREKNHSMVLQAIVDPEMRFRDIVTGWPGSMNESMVLRSSGFFKLCEKGKRLNGKKIELSEGSEVREYIIGDVAFPLLPWLVTPYHGKELSETRAEFNKRHFATRMVAQRALARLKEMWRIVQGVMWRPDKHKLPRIILVCCLLHNIVIDLEDEVQDEMPLSHQHDSGYRQQTCDSVDKNASVQRDKLSLYLSGRLPP
ncbi:PREDICTED: putative nuclease HARBI1 [Nelumbo nucifera]|uniref:DDE Tnp4 domain-containing protein n=2 Tax=Nelumbo nucifera TaxID=4432 RepID=A0A822Y983_NELNU|nr:PREDICTED: putative nuclease HARBI1 [Nelumbo nucifera]DAD27839.1 TPA_asm: hypothetical protein HUJ06_029307 [Nelumbo nucifera]